MEEDSSIADHKLCGFLSTVLTSTNPQSKTLEFGTPLHIFSNGSDVGFKSDSGIILVPISDSDEQHSSAKKTPAKKKLSKKVGVHGNGVVSVVHQVKTLVNSKCLKIVARVVGVVAGEENAEVRIVLLVDVYLPIDLWSGWQFPKSSTTAASLFRHLSLVLVGSQRAESSGVEIVQAFTTEYSSDAIWDNEVG
ncbi:hypothetical protein Cgig2_023110 [Carnegiea gigantea]|uniref:Uncharacterized protein n=1 Tax=Carnegiea gigantea TaxID=171969 RepID=A0A9Q1GSG1_9CARY|nr:hypothetical protein Cgig2_023110 [Carnegiea gigantea]